MLHAPHLETHILCKDQSNFFTMSITSGIYHLTVHYELLLPSHCTFYLLSILCPSLLILIILLPLSQLVRKILEEVWGVVSQGKIIPS